VIQQMRRLSALRLEVDMRQEAALLSLCVGGQVEQVMEEAPGAVSEVMLCGKSSCLWFMVASASCSSS
jgi:hypothetical protein